MYNYAWEKYYNYFSSLNTQPIVDDTSKTLKQTADEALLQNGIIYDENLKLYFDKNKNLHYDPVIYQHLYSKINIIFNLFKNSSLYFDYDKGIYYKYEDNELKYYSQLDNKVWNRIKKSQKRQNTSTIDNDDELSNDADELASKYPPCIRCIVEDSDIIVKGTLFLIPYTGGSIGSGDDREILVNINDDNVDKIHATIVYDNEKKQYLLNNDTESKEIYVNKLKIGTKEKFPLQHGDKIRISNTSLLIHIHNGLNTCNYCEPGIIAAKLAEEAKKCEKETSIEKQRRITEKDIKKKYGIDKIEHSSKIDKKYNDRAKERREKIGSIAPTDTQTASSSSSINKPINQQNIGFKLLSKMGWKEGTGIGKTEGGIREPINATIRQTSVGLGYSNIEQSIDTSEKDKKKTINWNKTVNRYNNISLQSSSHSVFNQNDEEFNDDDEY